MTEMTPRRALPAWMRPDGRGPSGIGADTPVMTPAGPVAAGRLQVGDRVITYDAGAQRIARIRTCEVPARALIHVSPAALEPGCDAPDMVIAAGQVLLIRDWRARAMFGRRAALVPAARMVDGTFIAPLRWHGTVRIVTFGFAGAARILQLAGGIEVQGAPVAAPALSPPTP